MRTSLILLLASQAMAQTRSQAALSPNAPAVRAVAPLSAIGVSYLIATPALPSLALMPALSAPALTASLAEPALAIALDSRASAEAGRASSEALTALLQGAIPAPARADAAPLGPVRSREITPGVIHLKFPNQHLMASTMIRFQEHYESPKYRGKVFSLEEFMDWYASRQKDGHFSYFKDWGGFNIPSRVLRRFKKGDFNPLTEKEQAFLKMFAEKKGRFYVIATAGKDGDPATLRHEVAHGLYYTRPDYRRRARALLKGVDLKPVFAMFKRLGYHPSVWEDEAHAWLGDSADDLRSEGLNPRPYAAIRRRLRALQKEYVSGLF